MSKKKRLNICLATSEMAPYAKSGGLADVSSALAAFLGGRGHDLRLLMPMYAGIDQSALDIQIVPELRALEMKVGSRPVRYDIVRVQPDDPGAAVYMLACPELFHAAEMYGGDDEHLRFSLLSRASIEMCQRMEFAPDIFHVHDWHTAMVPVYLKSAYAWDRLFENTRTVLTIHNIGYQGVFGTDVLPAIRLEHSTDLLDQEDLYFGRVNFMKAGIMNADMLTTVSPSYAREILGSEYGMGLERHLAARRGSLAGILNGVDYGEWNPETDELIPFNYSANKLAGKEKNKKALLQKMGMDDVFDRPLFGMVTRLVYQKGIELAQQVLPELLREHDFAVAVLGSGEHEYEQFFEWLLAEFPGRVGYFRGFNNPLAHLIEAGADVFMMPSRYEPCGLNQMYSLRYGTVPLVRATGGLADSVQHFDPDSGQGTGIVFHDFDANGLRWAMNTALELYANKGAWKRMVHNGMRQDYSWDEQGARYEELFYKLGGSE